MHASYSLADYFKRGHTLSFDGHSNESVAMLRSRSAALLPSRGPSLPVTAVDLSVDLTAETAMRRSLHSRIMNQSAGAFRRKCADEESAGKMLKQSKEMNDLLGDMHPTKDPKDIDKRKQFTYSIRSMQDRLDKKAKEDDDFRRMKHIDDFIRPEESGSPRSTGYEQGHIRSLLHLDIQGEAASLNATADREHGILPLSPNVDRYARYTGSPTASAASRASSASTTNSWRRTNSTMSTNSAFLPMMTAGLHSDTSMMSTMPLSLRKSADAKENNRVLPGDRLAVDAFARRKEWQRSYYNKVEGHKQSKKLLRDFDTALRRKADLARAERNAIRDFEKNLVLSRFQNG